MIKNGKIQYTQVVDIDLLTLDYEEDRPNYPGVLRCTGVVLEADNVPSDILNFEQNELYNRLAGDEFFSEDADWKNSAKSAVSKMTGVSVDRIEVENR